MTIRVVASLPKQFDLKHVRQLSSHGVLPWVSVFNEVIKAGQMHFITSFSAFKEKMAFLQSKPFNVGPVVRSHSLYFQYN